MKFSIEKTMEYLMISLGFILFIQGMIFLNRCINTEEIDIQMLSMACQYGLMGLAVSVLGLWFYILHKIENLEKRIERLEESDEHEDGPYISFLKEIFRKEKREPKPMSIQCVWGIFIISTIMGFIYTMAGVNLWFNYTETIFAAIGMMFMMAGFFFWVALCMLEKIKLSKEDNVPCQV